MCALISPFVRVSTAADTQNKCRVFTHTCSDAEGLSDNVKHAFQLSFICNKTQWRVKCTRTWPTGAFVSRRKEFHGYFALGEQLSSSNKVRKLRAVVVAAFARDSPWTQNRPCERTENRVPFTDFLAKWTIGRLVDSHRPLYIQRREFIGDLLNRTYRNPIVHERLARHSPEDLGKHRVRAFGKFRAMHRHSP